MIIPLSRLAGKTLIITQPSIWKRNYELSYEEEVLGRITVSGFFGSHIMVNFTGDEWELYYPRFWKTGINIREKGKENSFANYYQKFFSKEGTIFLPKGQRLKIKFGIFKQHYGIYTTSGICLANMNDKIGFKSKTMITIENSSEFLDKYPWAIILAWHLIMKRKQAARAAG